MAEYITIDSDLRTVTFPESLQVLGVQHDKETHKLVFEMPATFGDFDLSIFKFSINYRNPLGEIFRYDVTDVTNRTTVANGVPTNTLIFSWLVGEEAFRAVGVGQFIVCIKLYDSDGETILQEFNTALTDLPPVLDGLELPDDADALLIIDNHLRHITIPESMTILGVENDASVHKLYFRMPRYCSDVDLWSNTIIYINFKNANGVIDRTLIEDKSVSEDGNYIYFSWLVGRVAFEKAGVVRFVVCIQKIAVEALRAVTVVQDPELDIEAEFNTEITALPPVLEGLEPTDFTSSPYYDIITSYIAIVAYLKECYEELMPYIQSGLIITPRTSRRYFGTCETTASTETKLVLIEDESFVHENGVMLDVYFTYHNENPSAKLGIQVVHPENEPEPDTPEPDEPDTGTSDECNDPYGTPWADESSNASWNIPVSNVSLVVENEISIQNQNGSSDSDISLTATTDDDEITIKPIIFVANEPMHYDDLHGNTWDDALPYRWEDGEIVTFRYWTSDAGYGAWILEQEFQHGYGATAKAPYSTAWGHGTVAQSYGCFVIGEFNDISDETIGEHNSTGVTQGVTTRTDTNYAFMIGNGSQGSTDTGGLTTGDTKSNALTVTWNGDLTTGGDFVAGGDLVWNANDVAGSMSALQDSVNNLGNLANHAVLWGDTSADRYEGDDTVGSSSNPIYVSSGMATASNATIGSSLTPIWMNSGKLTAFSTTLGSGTKPIYMDSGTLMSSSSTVGSNTTPVYLKSGAITAASFDIDDVKTELKTYTDDAVKNSEHLMYKVVDVLPDIDTAELNTIYSIPDPNGDGSTNDNRIEYIVIEENGTRTWEVWGSSAINLSDYVRIDAVEGIITSVVSEMLKDYVTNDTIEPLVASIVDNLLEEYLMKDDGMD